jgi:hypothetical protein
MLPQITQIIYGHLDEPASQEIKRGSSYLKLRPGTNFLLKLSSVGGSPNGNLPTTTATSDGLLHGSRNHLWGVQIIGTGPA